VVRRGPWQRPVRIKDWEIDPTDLKWGAQLSRYSHVRAEQISKGKTAQKVPDTGPSRPQHALPEQSTDEGGEHWIETEKKDEVEGDEWVTEKDWADERFDWPGFSPKDPAPFPGLGEIGRF
jgi:hypothetical protein